MRILLVDDDESLLSAFSDLFANARPSWLVLTASNGEEAIELLISYGNSIDLVISDLRMPGLDGFGLKREINSRGIRVPLLFLSAVPTVGNILLGRQLGAISFLSKPITIREMIEAVDQALEYSKMINSKPELLNAVAEAVITQSSTTVVKALSESYTIGRSESSDIVLSSLKASRETAVLSRTEESYREDLPGHHYRIIDFSRNGFTVNGKKVQGYHLLKHGDLIEFPGCRVKYFVLVRELGEHRDTYS